MIFKKTILLVLLLGLMVTTRAQYFSAGEDPSSVKWSQINTEHFQLIFPESFGDKADYVANILDYSYQKLSFSLDHEPKKISVILHNQTIESNGFVSPTPYRMELFTVPSTNNLTVPWLEHLCIHELRHVVQVDKLNQGITKVLTYLFGQQATGAVAGLVPFWFLEGDAVLAETALTPDGRGRQSAHAKELKSITMDSAKSFSFNKMLLGSYKHKTPNHYSLGYHLTSYLRKEKGTYVWSDIEDYAARNPYFLASFNLGMKKHAGVYSGELFDESMRYYDSLWTAQSFDEKREPFKKINPQRKDPYVSYRFPQYIENDKIVARKESFSYLPKFVSISRKDEKVIHTPGIMTDDRFSYSKPYIAWSEKQYDLRWDHRSYSVIKLFDVEEKEEITLTNETRLFSPDLDKEAKQIVCVEVTEENDYSLVILNRETGFIQKQFDTPQNQFVQQPIWSPEGKFIYVIGLTKEGKTIYQVNPQTGKWVSLIEPTYDDIQHVTAGKGEIFFHADKGETDNIYKMSFEDSATYQLTFSKNGATDAFYSERYDNLLYTDYSSEGYDIHELNLKEYQPELAEAKNVSEPIVEKLQEQEPSPVRSGEIPEKKFEKTSYSRIKNLFRFHSWAPFYFDYQEVTERTVTPAPGLLFLSQNDLSTATSGLGYSYENDNHQVHTRFTYKGWYPVISVSSNYGRTPEIIQPSDRDLEPDPTNDFIDFSLDVSLPLTLNVNRYITRFIPRIEYEYGKDLFYNIQDNYYLRGLKTIQYNLQFYSLQRQAYRDIQPKWGVLTNLNYLSSPFSENILGTRFSLMGNVFLPGFFKNHGVKLTGGYQKQETDMYFFSSYLELPRGYESVYSEELMNFKADYTFPLFYPDWSISSLLYFKRFKANFFFDYARNKFRNYDNSDQLRWFSENLYSYGAEVTTDFHVARVMFPFTAGVRYAYQPVSSQHNVELVFNIDFYSLYNQFRKR
ncbi:MAG: TolB family protein [Bacteroidota bacterium]